MSALSFLHGNFTRRASTRAGLFACLALALCHAEDGWAQPLEPERSAARPAPPPAASEDAPPHPRAVGVVVLGARLPGLEASLQEALARTGMNLTFQRDVAHGSAPTHPQGSIRIWIDASNTPGASVLITDATQKVLESRRLKDAPASVLEEQLTLLVRTAVETALELRRLDSDEHGKPSGATPSASFAAVEAAEQGRPPTPEPGSAVAGVVVGAEGSGGAPARSYPPGIDPGPHRDPRAPWRSQGWVLELTPHVTALHVSDDVPTLLGAGLDVGVEGRHYIGSLGATLGLERFLEREVITQDVALSLAIYRASLLGRWSPLDRRRTALSVLVGPALVATSAAVHDLAPTLAETEDSERLDLTLSFRTEFRWWVSSQVALALGASLDFDPAPSGFATASSGALTPLVRDAQLRPGVSLGIASDLSLADRTTP